MKHMGWSWQEYMEAPVEFVNQLIEMLNEKK